MAWIDNSTLVGLRVFIMFGSWIALFGSYIYVEISGSHYWYNMFDVTILDLSNQYSNVIIIRVFLLILLASTTLSTLLTLSACEYAKGGCERWRIHLRDLFPLTQISLHSLS